MILKIQPEILIALLLAIVLGSSYLVFSNGNFKLVQKTNTSVVNISPSEKPVPMRYRVGTKSFKVVRYKNLLFFAENVNIDIPGQSQCFVDTERLLADSLAELQKEKEAKKQGWRYRKKTFTYPDYCRKFGRLYTWYGAKAACENLGGRLPTFSEKIDFIKAFQYHLPEYKKSDDFGFDNNYAYHSLLKGNRKEGGGQSEFNAVLGGMAVSYGLHGYVGYGLDRLTGFWTLSKDPSSNYPEKYLFFQFDKEERSLDYYKSEPDETLLYCRCVIDTRPPDEQGIPEEYLK